MSLFSSEFWDLYVALATLVSVIACGIFLKAQSVKRVPAEHAGGRTETTGHVWDGDLGEYNNPLPRWWAWLFYLTIFFSLGYLVLYPGLGSYKGLLGWTQLGQLEAENRKAQAAYGPIYERFAAQDAAALARDPQALAIGQKLFLNHCAQCHASDGGGSRGFPSLTDRDWLWGGSAEAIRASIAEGRTGVMPPFGPTLGEEAVKDLQHYVLSLSGNAHDSIRRSRGADRYKLACVACHGADGKGNPALGAPDLTDGIWLHGSGEAIARTIADGRASQMPAHKALLSPAKIHLLTAYVLSLSAPPK
jgi:cytochrome c oxidase cbb3-type subunit 3